MCFFKETPFFSKSSKHTALNIGKEKYKSSNYFCAMFIQNIKIRITFVV